MRLTKAISKGTVMWQGGGRCDTPSFAFLCRNVIYLKGQEGKRHGENEIILFETSDHAVKLNVNTDGDTVWLNRAQLAELFDRNVSVTDVISMPYSWRKKLDKEGNAQNLQIPNSDKSVGVYCTKSFRFSLDVTANQWYN